MRLPFPLLPFRRSYLFRAVSGNELEDIEKLGRFRNPPGLECKYFARTYRQAVTYADLAAAAYGEGPFWIVGARLAKRLIEADMCISVEDGIEVVVVPNELLSKLSKPSVIGKAK